METKLTLTPHCDEPGCGLGCASYNCPTCGRVVYDCDLYLEAADYDFVELAITCSECLKALVVQKQGYELVVKEKPSKAIDTATSI